MTKFKELELDPAEFKITHVVTTRHLTIRKFESDIKLIYVLDIQDTSGDNFTFCFLPQTTLSDVAACLALLPDQSS